MTVRTSFPPLTIRGRTLLPVVQGGMGVGISAHRLAGSVAREGAVGTIASIDLRHHHADLLARCRAQPDRATLEAANLDALAREIRLAKTWSEGRGMIAVNVMKAVSAHADYVRVACDEGADAIVMGAGLPLDLPDLTQGHDIALIPILSDSRGIALVLKKWMKKGRLPDAIVIEHPAHAGGHLGVTQIDDMHDTRFDFARVLDEAAQVMASLGLARDTIPLIVAGGINSHDTVRAALAAGANGVQVGTPFAVTEEGDAHPHFKRVLADATPDDIVEFVSVTGLPARAVKTPWLDRYLRNETRIRNKLGALKQRKRIAVVGAGPAGLGFAVTAAERGHAVTLYEAAAEIGGQFNIAKKVPGKEEFNETLRYFRRQIELRGVTLHLDTRATAEMLLEGEFDEVVLATGIVPRTPPIDGVDHAKTLGYLDVLRDDKAVGRSVAIVGAGGIGFDVAEFLIHRGEGTSRDADRFFAEWGVDQSYANAGGLSDAQPEAAARQVHLLQRKASKVGDGLGKTTGWIHRTGLKARGVGMSSAVTYRRIDDDGFHVTIDGVEQTLPVDNVVICAGQEPLRELAVQLQAAGCKVHLIGGADEASELDAKRAIHQGTTLAATL